MTVRMVRRHQSLRSDRIEDPMVISVWMTVAGQCDKASGHLQPSPSPAKTIPMKATATAVMYDLREIIYERGGMQISTSSCSPCGAASRALVGTPKWRSVWGGKPVESGAPSHVRGPIYTLRSCESKSPDAGGLGRHGSRKTFFARKPTPLLGVKNHLSALRVLLVPSDPFSCPVLSGLR